MRNRTLIVPGAFSGSQLSVTDLGTNVTTYGTNPAYDDDYSVMWDDPTGGSKKTKSVSHARRSIEEVSLQSDWDRQNLTQHPNPGGRYDNYCIMGYMPHRAMPVSQDDIASWIAVTGNTSNDIDDCIFNAYNSFVNGVRALDSSVSIAEAKETPHLFRLWQRRKNAPANIVNGFLNYSFGWRPLASDLRAVCRELRSFPSTVRKRLKKIGDGKVRRSFRFDLSSTVNDLNGVILSKSSSPYGWENYLFDYQSVRKSRVVVVTIRASVQPRLSGSAQDTLNKMGALGMIPSLATLWAVMRLSFVIDWFYNIGGAIENLQGSLTHNVSNVEVCVSDTRKVEVTYRGANTSGPNDQVIGKEKRKSYVRFPTTVPYLPSLRVPRRPMQFVLLGLLALVNTKGGKAALAWVDGKDSLTPKALAKLNKSINRMLQKMPKNSRLRANILRQLGLLKRLYVR